MDPEEQRRVRHLELEIRRLKTDLAIKLKVKAYYVHCKDPRVQRLALTQIASTMEEILAIEHEISRLQERLKLVHES